MQQRMITCLFFFLAHIFVLRAQQNMLLNPGMEEVAYRYPKSWAAIGSIDYYQNGSLANTTFEGNMPKFPPPASGSDYVGIRAFDNATEVLTGRLDKGLYKERWYRVSGYVRRPAVDCNTPVYGISVVLSHLMPESDLWYGYDKTVLYMMLKPADIARKNRLLDDFEWMEVFAYYQAKGGERFLWLGNFPGANAKEIGYDENWVASSTPEADGLHCLYHYYYDDFSVTPAIDTNAALLTVRNITFNSGSTAITEVNDPQMEQLITLLRDFPDFKIEVTGHTDADGKDAANLKLSAGRAEAVKQWFSMRSIAPERILAKGMGETQFVAPNDTEENKALNRRVEIKIVR